MIRYYLARLYAACANVAKLADGDQRAAQIFREFDCDRIRKVPSLVFPLCK